MAKMDDGHHIPEVTITLSPKEVTSHYAPLRISGPSSAADAMKSLYISRDREVTLVLDLDTQDRAINYNVISIGSIDEAPLPICNIFKAAILSNAASVILFHGHPSGSPVNPSPKDHEMTKKAIEAGRLFGIPVRDHIVIGSISGEYYSFWENSPALFGEA